MRIGLVVLVLVAVIGCKSKEEQPDGPRKLPKKVQEVMDASCAQCHTGPDGAAKLDLTAAVAYGMVDRASVQLPSMPLVTPGDLKNSYLIHKLEGTHSDVGGKGDRMPRTDPGEKHEDVFPPDVHAVVKDWVKEGAKPAE